VVCQTGNAQAGRDSRKCRSSRWLARQERQRLAATVGNARAAGGLADRKAKAGRDSREMQ
jgi:hypothetical protein